MLDEYQVGNGREVIFCNIGQCGVQAGNAAWELFCLEHNVGIDGHAKSWELEDALQTRALFNRTPRNTLVPRTVIADLEPTVIDEIRTGAYRQLFHPNSLINSMEDAASNYARGYLTTGKAILRQVLRQTRQTVEACDNFRAFLLIHSVGGGTGAGFTSLYLEHLDNFYAKHDRVCVQMLPGYHISTSIVEPYNVVLAHHALTDHADVVVCFDNFALYKVCHNRLHICRPHYNHLNRVIAQVYSDITCCYRFPCLLNSDLVCMQTNLVPYPRIHFVCTSYAPLVGDLAKNHASMSVREITGDVFRQDSVMSDLKVEDGLFLSCSMQYRGLVTASEVSDALYEVKRNGNIKFVDWNPTGFKIGLVTSLSLAVPKSNMAMGNKSLTLLSNTTAISSLWQKETARFTSLYSKRAFVHWYVSEGLEEGELTESLDHLEGLIKDYKDLEIATEVAESNVGSPTPPSSPILEKQASHLSNQRNSSRPSKKSEASTGKSTTTNAADASDTKKLSEVKFQSNESAVNEAQDDVSLEPERDHNPSPDVTEEEEKHSESVVVSNNNNCQSASNNNEDHHINEEPSEDGAF